MNRWRKIESTTKFLIRNMDEKFHFFLSCLKIQSKPLALFEVYNYIGFEAQSLVIKQLQNYKEVNIAIVSARLGKCEISDLCINNNIAPIKIISPRVAKHMRPTLVILTDSQTLGIWRSTSFAYLHHGSGFANLERPYCFHLLEEDDVDILFCLCHAEKIMAEAAFANNSSKKFATTGAVKLDSLITGDFDRCKFLTELGLDPKKKTIAVTSHWTKTSLYRSSDLDKLSRCLKHADANIIITGHSKLFSGENSLMKSDFDWVSKLTKIFSSPNMVVLSRLKNNQSLLTAADVLIGDHSSILLEYSVLNRPILMYRNKEHTFADAKFEKLLCATTSVFFDTSEVSRLLSNTRTNQIDIELRKEFCEYCFSHIGVSAKRTAAEIASLMINNCFTSTETE